MITLKTKILAGLVLGMGAMMVPSASASDVNFSFGFGRPQPVVYTSAPIVEAPVTTGRWVGEHYEYRTESVLVSPAHRERRFVEAVYDVRSTRFGHGDRVLVSPAHYEDVYVPAQYETRTVRVLVPGCYVDDPAYDLSINVPFRFGHDHFGNFDRFDRDHRDFRHDRR